MENTVNTMTITLDEYKRMVDEISNLQSKINSKDEVIKSLRVEAGKLEETINHLEREVDNASTTVFVQRMDSYDMNRYSRGVELSKSSPELIEIIKTSIDSKMEETIKDQEKTIEQLRDAIERNERAWNKDRIIFNEKREAKVKELNETIEKLTKDYEDLKLDKAANIVEAERLNEINKLKEQIAYLETSKNASDIVWPRGLFSKLFHKQIVDAAERLFEQYKSHKEWTEVNTTSAIGKAKDYLKTLNNTNTWDTNYIYNKTW